MQRTIPRTRRGRVTALAATVACAIFTTAAAPRAEVPKPMGSLKTAAGHVAVESAARGLDHPWGMAFLPDGSLLVTERPGRLRLLSPDGALSPAIPGTPKVFAKGQGGLMDVVLDPAFDSNRRVWLSFAEPGDGGASTALGHGRLSVGDAQDPRVEDFTVVFRQEPKVSGPNHFGNRIVFSDEGRIFLALGERFKFEPAQDLSNHMGTIVRIEQDGSVPPDNPFVNKKNTRPEIWSYGHRNIEAAALNPETGELWVAEMGPMGGDELNLVRAGENYGWPVVSWGDNYDGTDIPDPPTEPRFADAVKQWTPVIAPSGMIFYTGDAFPAWRGSALIGGLVSQGLVRVTIEGERVTNEERLPLGARIRDVAQAPDGSVYVAIDRADGEIWRLKPMQDDPEKAGAPTQ